MDDLRDITEKIAQSHELDQPCSQIRRLLRQRDVLEILYSHCVVVKHALGFTQIQVGEFDGKAVRVHLWPRRKPAERETTSDIHSHPWTLRSFVLAGTIKNRTYDVFESEEGVGELYEVRRIDNQVVHTRLNIGVVWRIRSAAHIQANHDYTVETSTYHSSAFTFTGAVTAIIASERSSMPARVIRSLNDPQIITRAPILLSETEKLEAFDAMFLMLERADSR